MKKTVIFEDEHIIVILKNGVSDFLFITFGDSVSLASGLNIYADAVSTKLQYTSLGFMAKTRNWYPSLSMNEAIKKCSFIINEFSSRFIYGGSMGGYAAIKYSKKLTASHTLVCCPQWSIDPYECGNNRNGYEKYFSENLSGMSIKPEDISGHIYVLYDPRHSIDSFHFSKIKYQSPNVIGICTDYIGHHVTTMISGSNNICRMVNAVQSGDVKLLNNIVFSIRKKSHFRRNNLLKESAKKHPYMTAKIALNGENIPEAVAQSLRNSISSLLETNSFDKVKNIINKLSSRFDIDSNIISNAIYMLEKKKPALKKIISHHDEILAYDPLLLHKNLHIFLNNI